MKNKLIPAAAALLVLSGAVFTQVVITPKKVIYKRHGDNVPEFKKSFEVRYPMVSGVRSARVKRRIENSIDYWKAFGITLEENLGDYHWLSSLDYKVSFNKDSVLVIELIMQGAGAYPDGFVKTLVVDQRTGRRVKIPGAFRNLGALLLMIDKAQKAEIEEAVSKLKKDRPDDAVTLEEMFSRAEYSIKTLDEYSVSDEGVTFIFDYGFPHAIQALEPEGRYFFKWSELREMIRPDGLFRGKRGK